MRPVRKLLRPSVVAAALAVSACAHGEQVPAPAPDAAAPPGDLARWPALAARLDAATLAGRFVQASALFLGTKYDGGPLGEGDAGGPDPDPRVCFDRVDCVTYLEQCLALALCREAGRSVPMRDPYLATLDRIRYRDGVVDYADRNHFTSLDWMPANAWLVEDVTARVGGDAVVPVTRTIDRAAFLREHGVEPRPGRDDARTITMSMIPRAKAQAVSPAIESGDLVFWAGKKDGILIVHTGLAVRRADGVLLFRHASSKAGAVTEEPLADYAAAATFTTGFLVLRLREGATP